MYYLSISLPNSAKSIVASPVSLLEYRRINRELSMHLFVPESIYFVNCDLVKSKNIIL